MKSSSRFILLLGAMSLAACGGAGSSSSSGSSLLGLGADVNEQSCSIDSILVNGSSISSPGTTNVMPVTVNGNLCGAGQYYNEPCTSVKICTPGTSTCATITGILVDTGSFGLRIFKSALAGVVPTAVKSGSDYLGECLGFGDQSTMWGQVETVDLQLASEPVISNAHIQVVDSSFATAPSNCSSAATAPSSSGFNGILGVGLMAEDCGDNCVGVGNTNNGQYYLCAGTTTGSACNEAAAALTSQVINPVALLAADNNGVILELASVASDSGAASVSGYLVLGIGTRTNNTPGAVGGPNPPNLPTTAGGVTVYAVDPSVLEVTTVFAKEGANASMPGFLDSGSSALFFPGLSELPECDGGYFCPTSTPSFSAQNISTALNSNNSSCVGFQIGDAAALFSTSNLVFKDLGVDINGPGTAGLAGNFDWGLPFFLGRNVYVGIEGKSTTFTQTNNVVDSTCSGNTCVGPFWAY